MQGSVQGQLEVTWRKQRRPVEGCSMAGTAQGRLVRLTSHSKSRDGYALERWVIDACQLGNKVDA